MVNQSQLTPSQLNSLDITARVSACLSLAGSLFTFISYLSYRPLRKPFNRLAFCIAIANTFGCLAYSWGMYPLHRGRNSAFCQTQGFFIEWFVMSDPLLVLTMATSVWLRVSARRGDSEIVLFENIGVACAFILPSIPAFVFLFWRPKGLTVYGPAGMWCWISNESNLLRIVAFYGPIWGMILCSLLLFMLSGRRILRIRAKVVKAQATCEPERQPRKYSIPTFNHLSWSKSTLRSNSTPAPLGSSSSMSPIKGDSLSPAWHAENAARGSFEELSTPPTRSESTPTASSPAIERLSFDSDARLRRKSTRFETMHWKYARFAFLCTLVLFITWIPISINRIYNNFINPHNPILGLYFASALCIPLHGFGNFIIYANNSWAECRAWTVSLFHGTKSEKQQNSISVYSQRGSVFVPKT